MKGDIKEKGAVGAKPPSKRGAGGKAPKFKLFLCLYSWLSRNFSPFYSPHPKPQVPNMAPKLIGWLLYRQKSFSSKLKNKGCFPIYFDVLNNLSYMHFVDWKPVKAGNRPCYHSVKLP